MECKESYMQIHARGGKLHKNTDIRDETFTVWSETKDACQ